MPPTRVVRGFRPLGASSSATMTERKSELLGHLEEYYRGCGWPVERAADGTVRARGAADVIWIGLPIVADDFDDSLAERLIGLSEVRMPSGERCPLELLPAAECEGRVRLLLAELGLSDAVSVYSVAAAA
jgi:hypothetical protein